MKLYHFTTNHSRRVMTKSTGLNGDGSSKLRSSYGPFGGNGYLPRIVLEHWDDFMGDNDRKWMCRLDTLPCMDDIGLWKDSRELGRLLYFIDRREPNHRGFALASFDVTPDDRIWVCEADWLRMYHDGDLNTYEAHIEFAESRVKLGDYREDYILPEFRVGNPIDQDRITWKKISREIVPVELNTRLNFP